MSARSAGAPLRLLRGSDHGLCDFDEHPLQIAGLLNLGGCQDKTGTACGHNPVDVCTV